MAHVLITGASSGIGAALAEFYAGRGDRLSLCGRNETRLAEVAHICRNAGAKDISHDVIDITDPKATRDWIAGCSDRAPLDLVIANAGISGGGTEQADREIFDVNLTGVLNTVFPAQSRMMEQDQGHIALVSSIAGNRGFPSAPAYSASKAAVLAYGEGLRGALMGTGITVSVICPGFVRSRITDQNDFSMPFFMEADRAAKIIAKGLDRKRAKISFPWQMRAVGWFTRALPSGLGTSLLSGLPAKGAPKD